jgi:hypothetical protein
MLRRGLLALAALLCLSGAAQADSLTVAVCGTLPLAYTPGDVRNDTVDVNGNKCISGNITATAVTAATAADSLPTVAPGAGPVYQSLGGAQYVQPVFGSANGGGTQVDSLNGLPVTIQGTPSVSSTGVANVNCVVGCSASGASSVTTTQGTIPWVILGTVTTTPSGVQSVSSTGQQFVYILGTPTVSTTGQETVLIGGIPSVSSTGTASVNCANCGGSASTVTTTQGTVPWVVSSTGQSNVGVIGTASVSTTGQSWITGTVALLGTPSVSTTGQQFVYILGTPTVSSTGLAGVVVVNTPGVSSTGDAWVTGTVQIQGTPTVSTTGQQFVYVLGTPTVSTTGQQTVLVGGIPTVSSTGVQAVNVVNTPTVSTTGQQTVLVGGTPTVSSTGVQGVNVVNTPAVSGTGQQWITGTVLVTGTQAANDNLANPTSSNILAYLLGWDPTNSVWRRVQVNPSTGNLTVSSTGQSNVGIIGTPAVSSTGDAWVTGTLRLQDATSTSVVNVKGSGVSATSTDSAAVVTLSPNPVTICTSFKNISVATSTDLVTSVNFLHICGILIVETSAQTVSLVEGTGTLCASGETPIIGGTLASGGLPLAANGGFNQASGIPFVRTKTMADHLCLLQSGSTSSTGYISYVDHQ